MYASIYNSSGNLWTLEICLMETYVFYSLTFSNPLTFLWQIDFHTFSKFMTMPCKGIELHEYFRAHVAHGLPT
jgi:hypothetical protein